MEYSRTCYRRDLRFSILIGAVILLLLIFLILLKRYSVQLNLELLNLCRYLHMNVFVRVCVCEQSKIMQNRAKFLVSKPKRILILYYTQ